ncbi:co-chaperone DjlA [Thalassotalea euphylliae]|uniref:Co-chaperone protein DjlA n=1 Tax=Thalassotalea euphylliae TaxID=1655234 RepID=A0A3E0TUN9_9GAMM|nr:co-chaperone DjlA [Thalassotalea euphylliae]REL28298.1 co-chaperone DjlA [Thalassotalea euphylliae]
MRIWGKLLGFLFGFMLTKNIFGALLGMWLGHRFDKGMGFDFESFSVNQQDEMTRQAAFFYTTFSVMGHIAKAKGRVTEHEIAFATAYMNKLGLKGELRQQAQEAFREGKIAGFPLKERLKKFKQSCKARNDLMLMFLEIQIQVAFADGSLDPAEREVLHKIAGYLGFSAQDLDKLLEMIIAGESFHRQQRQQGQHSGGQQSRQASARSLLKDAYKILGVSESASKQEVKKAYKKLMSQHHPDKLVAKGLPPEMMELAKQKTQDIQAAYDLVNRQL